MAGAWSNVIKSLIAVHNIQSEAEYIQYFSIFYL